MDKDWGDSLGNAGQDEGTYITSKQIWREIPDNRKLFVWDGMGDVKQNERLLDRMTENLGKCKQLENVGQPW